jgi:hypothetical protein
VQAEDAPEIWLAKLQKRCQGLDEPAQTYADSFLLMARKANVDAEAWKGAFKGGLLAPISRVMNGHRSFTDDMPFIALVKLAKAIEVDFKPTAQTTTPTNGMEPLLAAIQALGARQHRQKSKMKKQAEPVHAAEEEDGNVCNHCGKQGHAEGACWKKHPNLAPAWFRKRD